MNQYLKEKIDLGHPAHIYATMVQDKKICLVRIGSYDEIRHRYNQLACLIGAKAMRALRSSTRASYKPLGSWVDYYDNSFSFTEAMAWDTACQPPSELGDRIGYQAYSDHWPYGIADLPGMKNMGKSMSEIGNVFYGYDWQSSASTGRSFDPDFCSRKPVPSGAGLRARRVSGAGPRCTAAQPPVTRRHNWRQSSWDSIGEIPTACPSLPGTLWPEVAGL